MSRKERGAFTLLEILIVLAILGMGLSLITTMTTTTSRYSERVEEETTVQLACDNMMNSILSGASVALIGVDVPVPDAPNWSTNVELLDGPIPNLVAVRITAQRYQTTEVPSTTRPGESIVLREAEPGRRYVVKEWARRAEIKTRVVKTDEYGETTATDGSGETVWSDLNANEDGGALGGAAGENAPYDPFAAVDAINGPISQGNPAANVPTMGTSAASPAVGGGL